MSEHEANLETSVSQENKGEKVRVNSCEQPGCAKCEDGHCSACKEGMFEDKGICKECDWKCKECSAEDTCKQCRGGFTLNKEDKKCYQCKVRHCGQCDESIRECEECKEGYELREGKCELAKGKVSSSNEMSFSEFKQKYGKKYKDENEEKHRQAIYESNIEAMETIRESRAYAVRVNHLTDVIWKGKIISSAHYERPV